MTDIAVRWDARNGRGDWVLRDGDVLAGDDLATAVLVSLFTDRRAAEDFVPTDGTDDLRGWWGDTYADDQIGSRIWQYERAKKSDGAALLLSVQQAARESLDWLLVDGVASSVDVQAGWLNPTTIALGIQITQPDGSRSGLQFAWAWDGV
ncbi:MAG TPA: phage GP46 family protein [Roseomonas sp.]|nr:phage GP46 family protein [Roseomonas sp.]